MPRTLSRPPDRSSLLPLYSGSIPSPSCSHSTAPRQSAGLLAACALPARPVPPGPQQQWHVPQQQQQQQSYNAGHGKIRLTMTTLKSNHFLLLPLRLLSSRLAFSSSFHSSTPPCSTVQLNLVPRPRAGWPQLMFKCCVVRWMCVMVTHSGRETPPPSPPRPCRRPPPGSCPRSSPPILLLLLEPAALAPNSDCATRSCCDSD